MTEIKSKAHRLAREIAQGMGRPLDIGQPLPPIRMEELSAEDQQRLRDAMDLDALEHSFQESVRRGEVQRSNAAGNRATRRRNK